MKVHFNNVTTLKYNHKTLNLMQNSNVTFSLKQPSLLLLTSGKDLVKIGVVSGA